VATGVQIAPPQAGKRPRKPTREVEPIELPASDDPFAQIIENETVRETRGAKRKKNMSRARLRHGAARKWRLAIETHYRCS